MPTQLPCTSLGNVAVEAADWATCKAEGMQVVRLSAEEQRAFVDMLLNPPLPTEALLRAMAYHKKLIGHGCRPPNAGC